MSFAFPAGAQPPAPAAAACRLPRPCPSFGLSVSSLCTVNGRWARRSPFEAPARREELPNSAALLAQCSVLCRHEARRVHTLYKRAGGVRATATRSKRDAVPSDSSGGGGPTGPAAPARLSLSLHSRGKQTRSRDQAGSRFHWMIVHGLTSSTQARPPAPARQPACFCFWSCLVSSPPLPPLLHRTQRANGNARPAPALILQAYRPA